MSRVLSREDVLRLAPDASSAKSGQELAHARKWLSLGGDGAAIWGECKGSGAKPYQVQVDLAEPACKCSCPSRKFPCKHGLGLLLIYAVEPAAVIPTERPAWVQEWLDAREARAAKAVEKATQAPRPRDPAAQAQRRENRLDRARAGFADLAAWIRDLVRSGVGSASGKGFEFFDGPARRMVDAQAPGVARSLRRLASTASFGDGWQRPFIEQLSLIHLLGCAVERLDDLPELLRSEVETALGVAVAADELTNMPATTDHWQVIAQEIEFDEQLRVQRTWLYGVVSQRPAMILQFAHGKTAFPASLSPGTSYEGEIVYFPASGMRAAVRRLPEAAAPLHSFEGCEGWEAFLNRYSEALAASPWIERLCLPVQRLTPAYVDQRWWAIDAGGAALPAQIRDEAGFTWLAVSGGFPVDVAVEYDGRRARPLAVVADGRWISLAPDVAEAP